MEDVEDEPLFCERVAGIDIGKAAVMVTIRVPGETRKKGRQEETREFGTTRRELLALADWLGCWQVEKAGMEAASDYWKPVCFTLERAGFECLLYQAWQVKALPGRPRTDKLDSAWQAKITGRGSLAGSFVPPEEIRRLRTRTRYRRKLVQMRTAQKERCEKLLEDAHLKLSSVISDIHGVSGRDMLRAVAAGERNPKGAGADGAGGDARQDRPAGAGPGLLVLHRRARVHPDHDAGQHRPAHRPDRDPGRPDRGHVRAVRTADRAAGRRPGVRDHHRPGPDRRDRHGHERVPGRRAPGLVGAAGSPGERIGRQAQGQERYGRGNPYIGGALGEASISAGRTQTFLGEQYRRKCRRMPRRKAQGAIMRKQLVIAHALLSDPEAVYEDLGTDHYERRADIHREVRSHARAIERHGYRVILEPLEPGPAPGNLPVTRAS